MPTYKRNDGSICHISEQIMAKCIAEHDLTAQQVEDAILHCSNPDDSRQSGDPMFYGHIGDGRQVYVVLAAIAGLEDEFNVKSVYPVKKSRSMLAEKFQRKQRYERRKRKPKDSNGLR